MRKFIDLIGKKFGRLIVTKLAFIKNKKAYWECKCSCDNKKIIAGFHLTRKNRSTKSCGCLSKELTTKLGKSKRTHGHTVNGKPSKTYVSYYEMIKRCNDPKNSHHKDYGGRNKPITVCYRWSNKNPNGFANFLADMGKRPKNKTLDRIDNNDNYYKVNCRWSTMKEQTRNQRSNRMETLNGKTQCMSAWAEEYNIPYQTSRARLDHGMLIEEALTKPIRKLNTK